MSPGNYQELADLVRNHRTRLGLTQAQVAEKGGPSTGWIGSLEAGNLMSAPKPNTLKRLARVLGVAEGELMKAAGLIPTTESRIQEAFKADFDDTEMATPTPDFLTYIARILIDGNYSRSLMASACGMNDRMFEQVFSGRRRMTERQIERIAIVLGEHSERLIARRDAEELAPRIRRIIRYLPGTVEALSTRSDSSSVSTKSKRVPWTDWEADVLAKAVVAGVWSSELEHQHVQESPPAERAAIFELLLSEISEALTPEDSASG